MQKESYPNFWERVAELNQLSPAIEIAVLIEKYGLAEIASILGGCYVLVRAVNMERLNDPGLLRACERTGRFQLSPIYDDYDWPWELSKWISLKGQAVREIDFSAIHLGDGVCFAFCGIVNDTLYCIGVTRLGPKNKEVLLVGDSEDFVLLPGIVEVSANKAHVVSDLHEIKHPESDLSVVASHADTKQEN